MQTIAHSINNIKKVVTCIYRMDFDVHGLLQTSLDALCSLNLGIGYGVRRF